MRQVSLLCSVALILGACSSGPGSNRGSDIPPDWPDSFEIGFFGGEDAEEVLNDSEPLRVFIEERLGIPVRATTGTSYSAVIEAMRAERVDAMEVGPFSYCLAVQEAQAEALALGVISREDPAVYDETREAHYFSVIVTKKGNGIETVDDLRGKDFNFVDPASTSGHLMPKTLLVQLGLDPDNEMDAIFAGSHPTAVLPVWSGQSTACGTNELNLLRLQQEGVVDFCGWEDGDYGRKRSEEEIRATFEACPDGNLAILAMSDPIPSTPFAVRSNLPQSFKDAVREALLDVKNQPDIIATTRRWYADPTEKLGLDSLDQLFNGLRDAAKLLKLDLKELGG